MKAFCLKKAPTKFRKDKKKWGRKSGNQQQNKKPPTLKEFIHQINFKREYF